MKENLSRVVGVFFGSRSPEHDVSIITASLVISGLKAIGYNVLPVYVSKTGEWYTGEELGSVDFFKSPSFEEKLASLPVYKLDVSPSRGTIVFEASSLFKSARREIDIAFPCFHGPNGEDGTIQGLFELAGIPYVGCGVTSSALTMDKALTKDLYTAHAIPTSEYMYFSRSEWGDYQSDVRNHISKIGYPIFIKPARAGSSIGISRVENEDGLLNAVELGFHFDNKVVAEKSVENLADLTVAVVGNATDPDSLRTSLIQESRFSDEFFTYDEKYLVDGGAQLGAAKNNLIIPAELDDKTTTTVENMARHIYTIFECSGIARVDFLYDRKAKKIYANEINPLPGTLYHHLWRESGVSLGELLRELLRLADRLYLQKQELTYTFQTDILKQTNANKLSKKLHSQ